MTDIPESVRRTVECALDRVSRTELRLRLRRLQAIYREGGASDAIKTETDALAYAVGRMPATYAAVRNALAHAMARLPSATPRSLIDIGAGPGTATWAALDLLPDLAETTFIDSNVELLTLARLLKGAQRAVEAEFVVGVLPDALTPERSADIVVASYALAEMSDAVLLPTLDAMWRAARVLLLVVEPGTPAGSARIQACRDVLIKAGATVVAPCMHDGGCPLVASTRWCHFSQRLARSRDQRTVKQADLPFEDEKFSYLAVSPLIMSGTQKRRVLATPKREKGRVVLSLCAPGEVQERIVSKRDKMGFAAVRRSAWGDEV